MLTLYLPWFHRDSSVFWARLVTYFVVTKVVQWYNCGKNVPIFYNQTEAPDGWQRVWNFAHKHDEKSKASLYVLKRSGKNVTIVIQQNNLIIVKTRSKEEQRSRSTLQWDQRQTHRISNNLRLYAFQIKHEQHSRFKKNKRYIDRKCLRLTLSLSITFQTFHTFVVED